jgi:CRISPR-associated exonuclease Cas4
MPDQRDAVPRTDGPEQGQPLPEEHLSHNELRDALTSERFDEWYQEREFRKNIENGTPYFNGSGNVSVPERHSPSQLLQCHRKIFYRQCNAPAEKPDPDGIFWFGSRFEEDIVFPFLERAVTGADTYVRNSIWVDYTVETEESELRIKGTTDPVVVGSDADPVLPTEIKTKSSIENLTSPNRHHKAQLHAYLVGLSEKYDSDPTSGAILYGSRESLEVKIFQVAFDQDFWEDVVLNWAADHTKYRLENGIPPDDPEYDWECRFCSYRERCGRGDTMQADVGAVGLLPGFAEYPKEKVIDYLKAHEGAKLTPTLACAYPELADQYGAFGWECSNCAQEFDWDEVQWLVDSGTPPKCPVCNRKETTGWLRGPDPDTQQDILEDDHAQ